MDSDALMTFMAGRAGVLVPEALAVGRFGLSGDAAIVSMLPAGGAPPIWGWVTLAWMRRREYI